MDAGPTTTDLIAIAAEHGIAVTARQAERWRNERLIAPNTRRGRGQGSGSTWGYHQDEVARFVAAAELVVVHGCSISEAAVRLWIRGFGMDADLVRRHLRRAMRPMRRAREKLAKRGAEHAGIAALDDLRRRPKKRLDWEMRDWNERERDGVAAFVENIIGGYIGDGSPLAAETVARAKAAMGITPEVDAALAAAGNDMDLLIRTALPKYASLDRLAEDVTDEELLNARALCIAAKHRSTREAALSSAGASGAFVNKALDMGFDGASGLLTAVAGLRWACTSKGGPPT